MHSKINNKKFFFILGILFYPLISHNLHSCHRLKKYSPEIQAQNYKNDSMYLKIIYFSTFLKKKNNTIT
jgi:hypothetical protein